MFLYIKGQFNGLIVKGRLYEVAYNRQCKMYLFLMVIQITGGGGLKRPLKVILCLCYGINVMFGNRILIIIIIIIILMLLIYFYCYCYLFSYYFY